MVNEIITGIGRELHKLYPDYRLYDHNPEQGMKLPCFLVQEVNASFKRRISNDHIGLRGFDNMMFSVNIFPAPTGDLSKDRQILREVTENVRICTNYIEVSDGPLRTYAINTNYSDDFGAVLFRIRTSRWIEPKNEPGMEVLDMEERVKHGT